MTARICCDSCGELVSVVVITERRRGDFKACATCHADYVRQTAQNRRDEERERAEAAERSRKAAERDAARNEKRRTA